jgi:PAS domain S-box-containing protein
MERDGSGHMRARAPQRRERRHADRERLLRERVALLALTTEGVFGVDRDGRCTFVNAVAAEMMGYTTDDLKGQFIHELAHQRRVDGSPYPFEECPVHGALQTGCHARGEDDMIWRRDGTAVPVEYSVAPIVVDGTVEGAIVILRDASEQKAGDDRLRFLAEASTVLGASLDYDATLKSLARLVVPQLADCCLVDVADVGDGTLRRVATAHASPAQDAAMRTSDTAALDPMLQRVFETKGSLIVAGKKLAACADLGLLSCMVVPLVAHGRAIGVITFASVESGRRYGPTDLPLAEDVAHRAALAIDNARLFVESEARRREAESLGEIGQALTETFDVDTIARRIAEAVRALLAVRMSVLYRIEPGSGRLAALATAGDLVDLVPRGFVLPADSGVAGLAARERRPAISADILNDDRLTVGPELRSVLARAGYHAAMAVPLRVRDTVIGVLAVGDDRGRTFSAEQIRIAQTFADHAALALEKASGYGRERAARAEAEAANQAKDEFLATLSHELRTPLSAMLGWVRLLRSGKLDATTSARALETIERNTFLQSQLIEDLLDVSRIITGKLRLELRPVDIATVIEGATEALRPSAAAKSVRLDTSAASGRAFVDGDPSRLQQVIWNLLSNAIKFTPEGGRVRIALDTSGKQARITVSDTGAGISPEFLPHIFDRFRQADSGVTRGHGGLGLGLAIVRHLVELHRGTVQAGSDGPGCGATFTVTLPLAEVPAADLRMQGRTRRATLHRTAFDCPPILDGLKILVVDDEPDARELVTAILEECQAEVTAVASASEALEMLHRTKPDVLVSDIGMAGEDGYELIRKVREVGNDLERQLPAVALTAYASSEDRDRALAAGYQMYVAKPVDPAALVDVVAALAGRAR